MSMIRVLVVEDEALVRLDSADYLTDEGFEVMEAANAAEALDVLENIAIFVSSSRTSTCQVRWMV